MMEVVSFKSPASKEGKTNLNVFFYTNIQKNNSLFRVALPCSVPLIAITDGEASAGILGK